MTRSGHVARLRAAGSTAAVAHSIGAANEHARRAKPRRSYEHHHRPEPVPLIDRSFDNLGAEEERAIIEQINPPATALR